VSSLQQTAFLPAPHDGASEPSAPGMQKTYPNLMHEPHPRLALKITLRSSSYYLGITLPPLVPFCRTLRNESFAEVTPAKVINRIEVTMFLIYLFYFIYNLI
jgi:hypothetical protein